MKKKQSLDSKSIALVDWAHNNKMCGTHTFVILVFNYLLNLFEFYSYEWKKEEIKKCRCIKIERFEFLVSFIPLLCGVALTYKLELKN